MYEATVLVGLCAQTSLHAGAGNSVGAIDLPIQREAHTLWPCVFGSAVKGAWRAAAQSRLLRKDDEVVLRDRTDPVQPGQSRSLRKDDEVALFGPEVSGQGASEHAGALSVGDAKLLLLPLPTLDQAYRWVTCPSVLDRFRRDAQRLGFAVDKLSAITNNDDGTVLSLQGPDAIYLLEYRLKRKEEASLTAWSEQLAALSGRTSEEIASRLSVVSDALFNHLSRHGTPVAAHVRLESATKTVASGALWYEETLPAESLLYSPVLVQRSRAAAGTQSAKELLAAFKQIAGEPGWLQVGGNETVGMGWCSVHVVEP